ncbi:hypothetical protein WR25_03971 [Diploscapter pachys]|uniref:Uncharacterized protein n=1 Tax=Diploscapter pachys TaxID=2018661 RepID=A0A2A2JKK4_9BILA|nr:hypothetical protein WR25_03971 [Diploscapter pachys]
MGREETMLRNPPQPNQLLQSLKMYQSPSITPTPIDILLGGRDVNAQELSDAGSSPAVVAINGILQACLQMLNEASGGTSTRKEFLDDLRTRIDHDTHEALDQVRQGDQEDHGYFLNLPGPSTRSMTEPPRKKTKLDRMDWKEMFQNVTAMDEAQERNFYNRAKELEEKFFLALREERRKMKSQGTHQKGEQKKSRECDANVVYLLRDEEVPPHLASDKLGCTRAGITYAFMLKLLYAGCGWWFRCCDHIQEAIRNQHVNEVDLVGPLDADAPISDYKTRALLAAASGGGIGVHFLGHHLDYLTSRAVESLVIRVFLGSGLNRIHGILVDPVTRLSDLEAFQIVYLWMARACINSYELHHENDPHYATGPPASTILRLDVATVIALPPKYDEDDLSESEGEIGTGTGEHGSGNDSDSGGTNISVSNGDKRRGGD